jgi:hypothetical protein
LPHLVTLARVDSGNLPLGDIVGVLMVLDRGRLVAELGLIVPFLAALLATPETTPSLGRRELGSI